MRTTTFYLTALLAVAPAVLGAQDSTATSARVNATLDAALEAGIPVSLLERKIAEGRAKGVPMERIAIAVENRLEALTTARGALVDAGLTSTTEGELSVAADAVQAGVSSTALATIGSTAPQERRAVAIAVLAELVAAGHASSQALVQVQEALKAGPEALANLRVGAGASGGAGAGVGAGQGGVQVDAAGGARVDLGGRRN
jgi:hypothetical protein